MKTIKLNRIITITSVLLLILFSNPMFSQGLPEDEYDVDDEVAIASPVDQDIWLGLIGGCLISVYFISRKDKKSYNN